MNFLVCPDSFKDCLTSQAACAAITAGIKEQLPTATVTQVPLADGGEGTLAVLHQLLGGKLITGNYPGPYPQTKQSAQWLLIKEQATAVIEMAQTAGLEGLTGAQRNCQLTSTYGVGCQIKAALAAGVHKIIVTLGGSATNDGGCGMLAALGVRFYAGAQELTQPCGRDLARITRVDWTELTPALTDVQLVMASDVTNPLLGAEGATAVFAAQKGADETARKFLEQGMTNYVNQLQVINPEASTLAAEAGSGAAGGLGFGLRLLGAQMQPGAQIVMQAAAINEKIAAADVVITGEGSIDQQSSLGKLPVKIAQAAHKAGKPVIGLAGQLKASLKQVQALGFTACFGINPHSAPLEELLASAATNMTATAANVTALLINK